MAIIQAQPDYYVVTIDKTNPKIVIHHAEIVAWNIRELDNVGMIDGPIPITIFGQQANPEFLCHPAGIYTELATGVQYPTKVDFERVQQNLQDDALSKQGENDD